MSVDCEKRADGVVIPVRVQPKARQNAIIGEHAGALKVSVTDPPEKGKANKAVISLLAVHLSMSKSSVHVIGRETSRFKKILLEGITLDSAIHKISSIVEGLS